jgi:hypothetical protein
MGNVACTGVNVKLLRNFIHKERMLRGIPRHAYKALLERKLKEYGTKI